MTTNAANLRLAQSLAAARKGTFTGLIIRKVGATRGRGAAKVRYGDDLVHVVFYTGFRYENLVRRSLEQLQATDPAAIVADFAARGITDGHGHAITLAQVCTAVADLDRSFNDTLNGTNESTTEHVYEPLVVDGETVRGARVYKCVAHDGRKCHCRDCSGDSKAPVDGQINILGLRIGQKVIEAAPNGPIPPSKSRGDVVAKRVIRSRLPIGRLVSYRLAPGADYILRAGGAAALAADKDGVTVDPNKVQTAADLLAG